jgi:hypothetical protein
VTGRENAGEAAGAEAARINPVRAWALKVWGPADSWDNPLSGTRYDPVVQQHRDEERRHERAEQRTARRRARREHRSAGPQEPSEHYTLDEV